MRRWGALQTAQIPAVSRRSDETEKRSRARQSGLLNGHKMNETDCCVVRPPRYAAVCISGDMGCRRQAVPETADAARLPVADAEGLVWQRGSLLRVGTEWIRVSQTESQSARSGPKASLPGQIEDQSARPGRKPVCTGQTESQSAQSRPKASLHSPGRKPVCASRI